MSLFEIDFYTIIDYIYNIPPHSEGIRRRCVMTKEQLRKSVLQRLSTIKGHITGIEKMVEEDKNCEDVLFQLSAISGAVNKLSAHILESYSEACLEEAEIDAASRQRMEKLTKTMITMLRK